MDVIGLIELCLMVIGGITCIGVLGCIILLIIETVSETKKQWKKRDDNT